MSSLRHGLVGIGFWITDIVLLVRTRRDGGVLQISQGENGAGAAYFGAAVYIILLLSYLIFAPLQFGSLVFSLCVMIALFSMAAGRKGRHMLGLTIALWIVEAFALFCSALFPAVFPLHPAVIATDVLFFLAWTAQAVLCTVLTARTKHPSKARPASAAVQENSLA